MPNFNALQPEEILALNPWKDETGSSRSVSDTMEITRRQQELNLGIPSRVAAKPQSIPEKRTPTRHDVTDLVTGERVINPDLEPVSHEIGNRIWGQLEFVNQRSQFGIQDIGQLVTDIDHHLFHGFREIFTAQEQERFGSADKDLVEKCYCNVARLGLADRTTRIIDKTTASLGSHIAPLVSRINNPLMRATAQGSLDLWKNNKSNPSRNQYFRTMRWAKPGEQTGREYALPLMRQSRDHFSVGIMDQAMAGDNLGAGYEALMRILLLREKDGEYDFLDALNVVHELTHTQQHNRFVFDHPRHKTKGIEHCHDLYIRPLMQSSKVGMGVIEEESEAFAVMVELLVARIGFGTYNPAQVAQQLNVEPTQQKLQSILQLLNYAIQYYNGGGRKGDKYPKAFSKAIEDCYRRNGLAVFTMTPNGPQLKK